VQGARQGKRRATGRSQRQQLDVARRFTEKGRRDLADARPKRERAQRLQKLHYDRRRKPYEVGDRLLIVKKHLTQPADRDLPGKRRALWDGPYPVTRVLKDGTAFAYKGGLPAPVRTTGLDDVFTAGKVAKHRENSRWPSQRTTVPEPEGVQGEREYCVNRVIRHRGVLPRGRAKRGEAKRWAHEYLVAGSPGQRGSVAASGRPQRGGHLETLAQLRAGVDEAGSGAARRKVRRVLEDERGLPPRTPAQPPGETEPIPTSDAAPPQSSRPTRTGRATPATPAGAPEAAGPQPPVRPAVACRAARLVTDWERWLAAERAVAQYEAELCVVDNPARRALVLFSGSGSVEQGLRERSPGIETVSLNSDPNRAATRVCDIREFVKAEMVEYSPGHIDALWASPPGTEYSRALTTRPRELPAADQLVASALACPLHPRPGYGFLENPDGHLQHRPLMQPLQPCLHQVEYGRYSTPYGKDTCKDTWSNVAGLQLHRDSAKRRTATYGSEACTLARRSRDRRGRSPRAELGSTCTPFPSRSRGSCSLKWCCDPGVSHLRGGAV
jgi:hypothetical protein